MSKSFDIHKPLDLSEGVTRKGSRSWAITESKYDCKSIVAGEKTAIASFLLPLKIWVGDVVYVVEQFSGGKVVCRFTVTEVARGCVEWILDRYGGELRMSYDELCNLSSHYSTRCVIRFDKVQEPTKRAIFIEDLGLNESPMWPTVVRPPREF